MAQVIIKGKWFVYWTREYGAKGRVLAISWMAETAPPFRVGKAVRVRFGTKAYHLGFCRKSKKPIVREAEISTEEIRTWVY